MNRRALPGETAETPSPAAGGSGKPWKAAAAALTFFLGVSLTLAALGTALGRLVWERGSREVFVRDWQETEAFRNEISSYLEDFLTLGAGGDLDWYDREAVAEGRETVVLSDWDIAWGAGEASSASASVDVWEDPTADNPDYYFENDQNVLYTVTNQKTGVRYCNTKDGKAPSVYGQLPEGYNFLLSFQHGKVIITKDGKALDIYGDGIYDGDADWFVPGYNNFPAGEGVEDVYVYMAVRETPVRFYKGDYANGGTVSSSRIYWVYQSLQENLRFWLRQAALLGSGVLLLAVWFLLRDAQRLVNERLAGLTLPVWTELRFAAAAVALLLLLLPPAGSVASEIWWMIRYDGLYSYMLPYIGRALAASLENTGPLLTVVWVLWLIHNDHRYNPREQRRSLWRLISVRLPRYSFQRRMTLRNRGAAAAAWVLPGAGLLLGLSMGLSPAHWLFWLMVVIPAGAALLISMVLWKNAALARDMGLLADQVEAIRGGDLSHPLDLPADADLRQTAESLNDIQSGMQRALAEQTRSERMKVELVSNVSHDLKTPLTSILSYAELLRQEPLEGAAADYARIIDEKAQRLKGMVQDVFEVSKAAANQLPVNLERLDLAKLLRQTLADLQEPIRASGLTFRVDLPEEPVMITADGKRLYRVFQNLIDNALRYALPGSRVYLTLKTGGERAEASLRNTSRDELPEGVDFTARFVRGDESRTDGGSGLGLSIASSFTEACGGAFRVETVADLFTAVVTFPLAQ